MIGLIIGSILLSIMLIVGILSTAAQFGDWYNLLGPCLCVAGIIFIVNGHKQLPSAIDVYRNKTTLRIVYDNNIPVDTIVIYK